MSKYKISAQKWTTWEKKNQEEDLIQRAMYYIYSLLLYINSDFNLFIYLFVVVGGGAAYFFTSSLHLFSHLIHFVYNDSFFLLFFVCVYMIKWNGKWQVQKYLLAHISNWNSNRFHRWQQEKRGKRKKSATTK